MHQYPSSRSVDICVLPLADIRRHADPDILSVPERDRAQACSHRDTRQGFIAGRMLARHVLGQSLGIPAGEIVIAQKLGRPYLPDTPELHFSLSRSAGRIVLATASMPLGVDIERIDMDFAAHSIVETFFHPSERQCLDNLPPVQRQAAFFRLWTRKEALAKALGQGLGFPLNAFYVDPESGEVVFEPGHEQDISWTSHTCDSVPGYCLSLAVPHPEADIVISTTLPPVTAQPKRRENHNAPAHL